MVTVSTYCNSWAPDLSFKHDEIEKNLALLITRHYTGPSSAFRSLLFFLIYRQLLISFHKSFMDNPSSSSTSDTDLARSSCFVVLVRASFSGSVSSSACSRVSFRSSAIERGRLGLSVPDPLCWWQATAHPMVFARAVVHDVRVSWPMGVGDWAVKERWRRSADRARRGGRAPPCRFGLVGGAFGMSSKVALSSNFPGVFLFGNVPVLLLSMLLIETFSLFNAKEIDVSLSVQLSRHMQSEAWVNVFFVASP